MTSISCGASTGNTAASLCSTRGAGAAAEGHHPQKISRVPQGVDLRLNGLYWLLSDGQNRIKNIVLGGEGSVEEKGGRGTKRDKNKKFHFFKHLTR